MARRLDLAGRVFGRLTVLEYAGRNGTSAVWRCVCECGSETLVRRDHLLDGEVKSCGCLAREKSSERLRARLLTHGKSREGIYGIWSSMIQRCENANERFYYLYGGRGIKVCERWHDFKAFHDDMCEGYQRGLSIERIDVDGDYCPSNCRWATAKEQAQNRRNTIRVDGMSLKEYCMRNGLVYNTVFARVKRGVPLEVALFADKYKC